MILFLAICSLASQIGGGFVESFSEPGTLQLGRLGASLVMLDDWNGDGIQDYAVGAFGESLPVVGAVGSVRIYSGADQSVLLTLQGADANGWFGKTLCNAGDLDGDGRDDLLISEPSSEPLSLGLAKVSAISSATGTEIYSLTDGSSDNLFGISISSIGDVNGDGVSEFIVSASRTNNSLGAAYVYSGVDGTLFRTHLGGLGSGGTHIYGHNHPVGDMNGDGVPDYVISDTFYDAPGSTRNGILYFHSGADGSLLFEMVGGFEQTLGRDVLSLGDFNGDSFPEFAVTLEETHTLGSSDFSIRIYDGASQLELYQIGSDQASEVLGGRMILGPDFDGDGHQDFFASGTGRLDSFQQRVGAVSIYSSASGVFLGRIWGTEDLSGFGSSLGIMSDFSLGQTSLFIGALNEGQSSLAAAGAVYGFSLEAFLELSSSSVSASAGGQIDFDLDFSTQAANRNYIVLASQGTGPIGVNGIQIPLSNDLFLGTSRSSGIPMLANGAGVLDSNGEATATWSPAAGFLNAQAGRTVHFVALVLNAVARPVLTSMQSAVTILP